MPTQAYKVIGKPHRRVSMYSQTVTSSDGSRMEIQQNGPLVTYNVGDVIEDIRPEELIAFPDRFQAATSAEVDAWHEQQSHLPMVMRAPGLNAEQAVEHAELTRQIEELQAKQQELLTQARTPVPTELPMPASPEGARAAQAPPGRRSENLTPGSGEADAPGHMSVPPPTPGSPEPGPETAPGRRR